MKKVYTAIILCTLFVYTLSFYPVSAFQENSFSDSQYEQIGSLGLGHLISDGQVSELDFSSGSGDTSFLIALGKSIVTKDPTYVLEYGLEWATDKALALLQSLQNWFMEQFPDLYEFFSGEAIRHQYHPMPLETRKNFTRLLKDRVDVPDPIVPNPDANYAQYIELINGTNLNIVGSVADFFTGRYNVLSSNITSPATLQLDPLEYTIIPSSWNYNISYYPRQGSFCYYSSPNYYLSTSYCVEPITIYINNTGSNYIITTSSFDVKKSVYVPRENRQYFDFSMFYELNNDTWYISAGYQFTDQPTITSFQYQGSLEDCFKVIACNFRNVDIYVNGNIWAVGHFTSDDSNIFPIGIPDNFEILSGVQGGYYYPPDSYWNLDGLVQLIKQAITEYGVININDIAPLIVDVNGVQAVRTVNIARTDYDNLISEQYSIYPSEFTGLKAPDFDQYKNVTKFISSEAGSNLIPDDIFVFLGGCGILLLIGFLINRMLE